MSDTKLRILHIAPQNFAGMPYDFVKMHNDSGYYSRLITLYRNTLSFPEDISLEFPLPKSSTAKKWRDKKAEAGSREKAGYSQPKNVIERFYFKLRDELNSKTIYDAVERYSLHDFDVYHFDGGMDLFRDCRFAKNLKQRGKKIVCCYFGSDLRTRGIFKELDDISDLKLTVEFDHLKLHPGLKYIFFPFDEKQYNITEKNNKKVKVIHSPTNRRFKGTDKILKVIDELEDECDFEFILLENLNRHEVIEIKSRCDVAIDQVGGELGGSGYGRNSIENLSMGIPTITEFSEEYLQFLNDNPFVHSTIHTLKKALKELIEDGNKRKILAVKGRQWVEKYHSYKAVNELLMKYYSEYNII